MHCARLTCACFSLNILPGFLKSRNKTLTLSSSEWNPAIPMLGRELKAAEILRGALKGGYMVFYGQLKDYVGWERSEKTTCGISNGRTLLHCPQLLET